MVGKVRDIRDFPECPIAAATVDHWFDRAYSAHGYDEITFKIVSRICRNKNQIFENGRTLTRHLIDRMGGPAFFYTLTRDQRPVFQNCWLVLQQRVSISTRISTRSSTGATASPSVRDLPGMTRSRGFINGSNISLKRLERSLVDENFPSSALFARFMHCPTKKRLSDAWLRLRARFLANYSDPSVNCLDPRI
jgi:hypothetical protein